jgi:UDP-glucose 4-epimerase
MRVIVTGGAGFIGSHVIEAYIAKGHEILVVDSLWEHGGGKRANVPDGVEFVQMDIRDKALSGIFDRFRPDIISHHAAQHSVAISSRDPIFDADVNIIGLLNLLENASHPAAPHSEIRRRFRLTTRRRSVRPRRTVSAR